MNRMLPMNRRVFLKSSLLAALSGVAVTVTACGVQGQSASSGDGGQSGIGEVGAVAANHGHSAFISEAKLLSGGAVLLDITGASAHPHTVSLSAAQVQAIANGTRVTLASSLDDGHNHTVTFN